jgi:hypothetical protein
MHADANSEGFRILRREPSMFLMELLWRWSFGLGLMGLAFLAYTHLRQAILISDADRAILSSEDPLAIASFLAGLFAGAQPLLLRTLAQVSAAAAVLWVFAATPGRALLTRLIARRFAADYCLALAPDARRLFRFAILNIARALMLLILVVGFLAGARIAARANPEGQNLLSDALIVFASVAVSAVLWSWVNWVLSLAPIFVVRDGRGALGSIAAALAFIRRNYSHLAAIAMWNSTQRGLTATAISLAAVATATWHSPQHAWFNTALLAVETLSYLLVSDYLLSARLAAYTSVAVRELQLRVPQPPSQPAGR